MTTRNRPSGWEHCVVALLLILGLALFVNTVRVVSSYDATNVTTTVNITNTKPVVTQVIIDDAFDMPYNVTLSQGSTRTVLCNATVIDYNSHTDITLANATFYHSTSSNDAADDRNDHYSNIS